VIDVTKGEPTAGEVTETAANGEPSAWKILEKYLRQPSLLLLLLGLTTLVLYSGALFFEFVWDDWPQIVDSPIIRSWSNLPRAFGSDLWYHAVRQQVYYRPLFVAWSILNYALFKVQPWGWHLGAILLHVAAVMAVFWLARKLGLEYWTAALAALIFALHPIHIEPVVWISAASDTMVTIFVMLAFVAFLNGRNPAQSMKLVWWLGSLVLLACALLTKEMALTFAAIVAVYAWLRPAEGKSSFPQRLTGAAQEAAPYAVVTIAYLFLRKHALVHATGQFDGNHGVADMLRTWPLVIGFYLKKLVLPVGLTGLYYTPYVTSQIISQLVVPVLALGALVAALWYWNRGEGKSTVAFMGLWFLIGLAPALYLRTFANGDFVRDRYVYLPSVGFAILLAMALRSLPSIKGWSAPAVQGAVAAVLCLAYAGASLAQQVDWANDLLVMVRGYALYPDNPYTMVNLANEYSKRGANQPAIELAERAARTHPEYLYSRLSLAEVYVRAGRVEQGRVWLQEALKVTPEYAKSESGMAGLAGLYGQMGDYPQALIYCNQILQKDPDLYSALYNCGIIHLLAGEYGDAQQLLGRAVETAPELAAPRHFFGRALLEGGKNREAEPYLEAAVAMDPNVSDYHYWLGVWLEENQHVPDARVQYQETLQLSPENKEATQRLAALGGK